MQTEYVIFVILIVSFVMVLIKITVFPAKDLIIDGIKGQTIVKKPVQEEITSIQPQHGEGNGSIKVLSTPLLV